MSVEAVFVQDGGRYLPSDLALGPWYADALHGGAPAALLVHELLDHAGDSGLRLARVTYEFVRPVPRAELSVEVEPIRPGRRVTLLEATMRDGAGTVVARARALFVAPSPVGGTPSSPPPFEPPEAGVERPFGDTGRRMFATDAMEIRFVEGSFREPGDATAWFRLRHPLVAGLPVAPAERVAAAADFGNGIGSVLSWDEHLFINPDLTVQIERDPVDEWVALQAQTIIREGGVGVAESVLYDRHGRIGRATQSLLIERR